MQVIATIWYLNSLGLWFLLNISELQREMDCTNWTKLFIESPLWPWFPGYSLPHWPWTWSYDLLGSMVCKWRWHTPYSNRIFKCPCAHCSNCSCPLYKNIMYPQIWLYSWVSEQEDIEQSPSQSTSWRRVIRLPVDDVCHEQQWLLLVRPPRFKVTGYAT